MTLLEEAIESLRSVPAAQQDHIAEAVPTLVEQYMSDIRLTPEQVEEVRRTIRDLEEGRARTLSDEEVEAMWRRLGV